MSKRHSVVTELVNLFKKNKWEHDFDKAVASARKYNIPQLQDIRSLDD